MAAERDDGSRSRSHWRPTLVLALCAGFSIWLILGDPGIAAATTTVLFVLVATLHTAGVESRRHPPGSYYVMGPTFVLVAGVLMTFGGRRPTAWHDLQPQYRSRAPAPAGAERQARLVLVRRTSAFTVQPFRYRRIFTAFDDDGVYLAPSWPQSLVYDALRVPRQDLRACGAGALLFPGHTAVRIAYPPVEITVPDADERILGWCRQHGIEEGPG